MAGSTDLFDEADGEDRDGAVFADINVTPLVDVMLVLLVVFMVTAPLMAQGVPVDLPKAGGTALGRPAKSLVVSVARDGSVFLRDETVASDTLAAHLQAIRDREGDVLVYVRADRSIPYGAMMDVIGRLGQSGFHRVSLLSLPSPGIDRLK